MGSLGSAYLNLGYAIDYFKKALAIAKELDDTDGKQGALGFLAFAGSEGQRARYQTVRTGWDR